MTAIQGGGDSPIAFPEVVSTMMATFALEESRCLGQPVAVKQLRGDERSLDDSGFDRAS